MTRLACSTCQNCTQGFIQDFLVCVWRGGGSLWGTSTASCRSSTIQIFKFWGGGGELRLGGQFQGPLYIKLCHCIHHFISLQASYNSFIDLQDKLHHNIGR